MKRVLPHVALALVFAELLLILVSWIMSAAMPMSGVRSLLSSEGIRWFLGHFADMLATPVLVWLLLLAMAWGCLHRCGILDVRHTYRSRRAWWLSVVFMVLYIGVVLLLTLMPHAVLLSVSGSLWPSPFSASLIPVAGFGLLSTGIVYGVIAGSFQSLTDIYESLLHGLRQAAPLLLFYFLLTQFYESLCFVFTSWAL